MTITKRDKFMRTIIEKIFKYNEEEEIKEITLTGNIKGKRGLTIELKVVLNNKNNDSELYLEGKT